MDGIDELQRARENRQKEGNKGVTNNSQFKTKPRKCLVTRMGGGTFNPYQFNQDDVNIFEIAQALSQNCRFNGHTMYMYSVAQHSILVKNVADRLGQKNDIAAAIVRLGALIHDASEAYISDIASPLKNNLNEYMRIETMIQNTIHSAFGIHETVASGAIKDIIDVADQYALALEARDVIGFNMEDPKSPFIYDDFCKQAIEGLTAGYISTHLVSALLVKAIYDACKDLNFETIKCDNLRRQLDEVGKYTSNGALIVPLNGKPNLLVSIGENTSSVTVLETGEISEVDNYIIFSAGNLLAEI